MLLRPDGGHRILHGERHAATTRPRSRGGLAKCIAMHLIVTPEATSAASQTDPPGLHHVRAPPRPRPLRPRASSGPSQGPTGDEERGLNGTQYIVPGAGGIERDPQQRLGMSARASPRRCAARGSVGHARSPVRRPRCRLRTGPSSSAVVDLRQDPACARTSAADCAEAACALRDRSRRDQSRTVGPALRGAACRTGRDGRRDPHPVETSPERSQHRELEQKLRREARRWASLRCRPTSTMLRLRVPRRAPPARLQAPRAARAPPAGSCSRGRPGRDAPKSEGEAAASRWLRLRATTRALLDVARPTPARI